MDEKITELKEKLFKYRMDLALGKLKNTSSIRKARREIARVLTPRVQTKKDV